jgi:hypothetical protein
MTTSEDRLHSANARLARQRTWIEEHGNDRAGYVARWGSSSALIDERRGDGGEKIYEADLAALHEIEAEIRSILGVKRGG